MSSVTDVSSTANRVVVVFVAADDVIAVFVDVLLL